MAERALVQNAADPKQVRQAARRQQKDRDLEIDDIRTVMNTVQGRRFLWRLMGHCKTFESVFSTDAGALAYNSGRQDVGHFLIAEVNDAVPAGFLLMMQESQAREKERNDLVDATHTPSATQENPDANS